jgi:serine/threonine protein kinase
MAEPSPQRIEELFDQAIDLDPARRAAFLDEQCKGDADLRAAVEKLLHLDSKAQAGQSLLRSPLASTRPEALAQPAPRFPAIVRYRVVRLLGEGGMGTVYEAEQDNPRRTVALKVLRAGLASPALLARFRHEAQILGRLHNPGIAQIYEAGLADDGQPFFAMEFIRGLPLDEYADRHRLDVAARLALLARVCDTVQHAHDQGVIHRDLKPANILVEDTGQPKVLDFGVARATDADLLTQAGLTRTGQVLGTPDYMSPEQVAGDPAAIDHRADVYALGVILFELLAHRPPYQLEGRPLAEMARLILEAEPPRLGSVNPELRGDVETIVAKALAKDPARRYQSAADMAADLRRWLAHEPIQARPPSALYQLRQFARRHKALVGGVFATVAALVLGLLGTILFAVGEARQRRQADAEKREAQY